MSKYFSQGEWERDVRALRDDGSSLPHERRVVQWWVSDPMAWAGVLTRDPLPPEIAVAIYPAGAQAGAAAELVYPARLEGRDPSGLEGCEEVDVFGWIELGRACVAVTPLDTFWPKGPPHIANRATRRLS